jgi:SRSO17 transposase
VIDHGDRRRRHDGAPAGARRIRSPEASVQHFDALLSRQNHCDCLRRYLEGLLLPSERAKTLTALANTEPMVGAQQPAAQRFRWFLSEAARDLAALIQRRIALLRDDPVTARQRDDGIIVDETGDLKDGTQTAYVGRQYLANLGKIDKSVVSDSTVRADQRDYYPLEVEP